MCEQCKIDSSPFKKTTMMQVLRVSLVKLYESWKSALCEILLPGGVREKTQWDALGERTLPNFELPPCNLSATFKAADKPHTTLSGNKPPSTTTTRPNSMLS